MQWDDAVITEEVLCREVHELLERHGWILQRISKAGEETRRVYVSDAPGAPVLVFPVRQSVVLRAYYERIKSVIERFETGSGNEE